MTPSAQPRGTADVERELAAARARLAEHLGAFVEEFHPRAIVRRTWREAKDLVASGRDRLLGLVCDEHGPRPDVVVKATGLAVGAIIVLVVTRQLRRR